MKSLKDYKEQQMKNEELAKEYELIQPEMDVVRASVDVNREEEVELLNDC